MGPEFKSFQEISGDQAIVAVQQWQGLFIVATAKNLYAIGKDGSLELMKFEDKTTANGQLTERCSEPPQRY